MRTSDLLSMCVQNLRRRKFRTFLTVIGVVIGTTAIISMISLGIGINKANSDLISSWGDLSMIDVYGTMDNSVLDDDTLQEVQAMPAVTAVTPFMRTELYNGKIVAGRNDRYQMEMWNVIGVYPDALESLGFTISEGRNIEPNDKYIELVVGSDFAYSFEDSKRKYPHNFRQSYPDEFGQVEDPFINPLVEDLTFSIAYGDKEDKTLLFPAKVVGMLDPGEGEGMDAYERRGNVYLSAKELQRMETEYKKITKAPRERDAKGYNQVRVRVGILDQVSVVEKKLQDDYQMMTSSMESVRQDAMAQTQQMQVILGGLGAISLLVASISIANTMVMSVYERTREIGIMKVVGCYVADIRRIFLVEASLIGFFGGLIGVVFSYLISFLLNTFGGSLGQAMGLMTSMDDPGVKLSVIPLWLVALGMIFATTIGVVAGMYPARRAMKISALEAIKTD